LRRKEVSTAECGLAVTVVLALLQWVPAMTQESVYDRYGLVLLPPLIAVSVAGRMPPSRVARSAACAAALLLLALSVEWTRAYIDRAQEGWAVAEEVVATGAPASEVVHSYEWRAFHLFAAAVERAGGPDRITLEHGEPWGDLVYNRYVVTEDREGMLEAPRRSYRPFLRSGRQTIGVRDLARPRL
jgi:hypothetical protein